MKTIKVSGTGCANGKAALQLSEEIVKIKGVDIQSEKVESWLS